MFTPYDLKIAFADFCYSVYFANRSTLINHTQSLFESFRIYGFPMPTSPSFEAMAYIFTLGDVFKICGPIVFTIMIYMIYHFAFRARSNKRFCDQSVTQKFNFLSINYQNVSFVTEITARALQNFMSNGAVDVSVA